MKKILLFYFLSLLVFQTLAQTVLSDSTKPHALPQVSIVARSFNKDVQAMPEVLGQMIFASKKTALIDPNLVAANLSNNSMRQMLAKVPGIHIWENDGSGIQIGIAARGLSPNRSWDFNIRQNGYDIAADPYGYPEAYYHPPMNAVDHIELVRGSGALQYGPQLGGMVNYVLKDGSALNKKWELESTSTAGSNNLWNQYLSVGSKFKNGNVFAFYDHRQGSGWRDNNSFKSDVAYITSTYSLNSRLKIKSEFLLSNILSQQPGGLTDSAFQQNARQSSRARNWMQIIWSTTSINIDYTIGSNTSWNTKLAYVSGHRNSVGMLGDLTMKDTMSTTSKNYSARIVQKDFYKNIMLESRVLTQKSIGHQLQTFSAGIRFFNGQTNRLSNGKGTAGMDADFSVSEPFTTDVQFQSQNFAIFAESIIRLNNRLSLVPGIRAEWLHGEASGQNGWESTGAPKNIIPQSRMRRFVLMGLGTEYQMSSFATAYANITQAYRPIQFSNLQIIPGGDSIHPNLQDARGYNTDAGFKGQYKDWLQYDVSAYFLSYQNRIGTILDAATQKRIITNIGKSISKGVDLFVSLTPFSSKSLMQKFWQIQCYSSYSYTDARYASDFLQDNIKGKKVENAPEHILRSGIKCQLNLIQLDAQYSYVAGCYSDAGNTFQPNANGQIGWIPSYNLIDLTTSIKIKSNIQIKAGVNNLMDVRYFTRRSAGYPGPGLLPGDGRTVFFTVMVKS